MAQQTALAEVNSAKFVAAVERQFAAEMGSALAFTDYEKTLAQHLFLKVDVALKTLEAKRLDQNATQKAPFAWPNVNMTKLALDGVHRVNLGLDALIPNHISPIPYWNKRLEKYDLDLRVGYVGQDFCRRNLAVETPVDVIYELVFSTDKFRPIMRSLTNKVEGYEFEITTPFQRGDVIGGFGYIMYANPEQNRLVLVTERDFKRAEAAAGSADFWGANKSRQEMQFKTIVHRVTAKIPLDPRKVNAASYAYVEAQETEGAAERDADANANGKVIDITPESVTEEPTGAAQAQEAPPTTTGQAQAPAAAPAPQKPARELATAGAAKQQATLNTAGPGY